MKKTSSRMNRYLIACLFTTILMATWSLTGCKKDKTPDDNNPVASHSAEVVDKWMTLQLRLMRNATGIPNQSFSRHFAYTGMAAFESIAPGLPLSLNQYRKWNGVTGLPSADQSFQYYYPANANAAMAAINKAMFPNASAADKQAIDSLETALNNQFLTTQVQAVITKSNEFGKAVATAIYNWAESDGYKNANSAYTPPTGVGQWVATAPAYAAPSTPYWGNNRSIIVGSTTNALPAVPTVYSTSPTSLFYLQMKQVYDVSTTLTDDQKAIALFWRDVPGVSSPGHWLSILQQALRQAHSALDKAALAYALTGAAINDALITCWTAKYQYNTIRPITFIRDVLGHNSWNSFIGTPPHPEYPSAHSVLSAAGASMLGKLFVNLGSFTDHTYDYLGFAPRTYSSFTIMAEEAGQSRLYAGIHLQSSIDAGILLGKKVAANIVPGQVNP